MVFDAGVVLYNPTEENIQNIQQWISTKLFKTVTIYDNSSQSCKAMFDPAVIEANSVRYVFPGQNNALSIPYNQFIERCIVDETDYLCLFDQDSDYPIQELEIMVAFINRKAEALKEYAVLAPRCHATEDPGTERKDCITDAAWVINSGSILNVAFLREKQLRYDENIFLDGLDYEFCWTARELGGKIGIYENAVLVQALGTPSRKKGSKWFCHSAFRYYLITKNMKYIWKKHKGFLGGLLAFGRNVRLMARVLMFEDECWPKFKACLKGMFN